MPENKIHSEDDMDLTGVRATLIDLLRIFFKTLDFAGLSVRKHKFFIIISFIAGIAVGFVYRTTKSSQRKATMIVQFNKLTKRTLAEMVEQLNHLVSFGQSATLAHEMNLPETIAQNLRSIEAVDMEDKDLSSDTSTRVDQPFKIVAVISDNSEAILDSVQTGVLHYLNYSPLLARMTDETQRANEFKLQTIDSDLVQLDSLKREYNHFLSSSKISATYYNSAANPAEFYAQTLLTLNQREIALRELNVNKLPLAVVDSFKMASSRGPVALPKIILIGIAAALLAILVSMLMEARKRVMAPVRSDANPIANLNSLK